MNPNHGQAPFYWYSTIKMSTPQEVVNDLVASLCVASDGGISRNGGRHRQGVCHQVSHTDMSYLDGQQAACLNDAKCLTPRGWIVNIDEGMPICVLL